MSDQKKVFQLLGDATAAIYPLARDIMRPLFEKHFSEQRLYGPTFLAFQRHPEPITAALMETRNPYNNPEDREEILEDATEAGFLVKKGGSYAISDKGSKIIAEIHQAFYTHVNQVNAFPAAKTAQLAGLLEILVKAVAGSGSSSVLFCFNCSHQGHPEVEPGTLARIDQLLDDLNAFRDDAHVAAWKDQGITGPTLEVLTLVWNGEANNPEKLVERLPYRSFQAGDYQAALDELAAKGWIEKIDQGYQVTAAGKQFRDGIENATDQIYYEPWGALTDEQLAQLGSLLQELINANQPLIEDESE